MKTLLGTVENGVVTLPPGQGLPEGARVLVAVCGPAHGHQVPLPLEIEEEDLAFVRACRGRLADQLRAEGN